MPKPSRRDDIIKTAHDLFNEFGYHGTGIDLIIQQTRISKKTLYTYFRSKEELIIAVLEYSDQKFDEEFIPKVEKRGQTPEERLLAIFDVAKEWFMQSNFFGCMFINAIGEYAEEESIRSVCKKYKSKIRDYMALLCQQAGLNDPEELANELALLLEGAIVTAQVNKNVTVSDTAKKIAAQLISDNQAA